MSAPAVGARPVRLRLAWDPRSARLPTQEAPVPIRGVSLSGSGGTGDGDQGGLSSRTPPRRDPSRASAKRSPASPLSAVARPPASTPKVDSRAAPRCEGPPTG